MSQMRTWNTYPHLRMQMVGDSAQRGRLRHRGGARGERMGSELGDEARSAGQRLDRNGAVGGPGAAGATA